MIMKDPANVKVNARQEVSLMRDILPFLESIKIGARFTANGIYDGASDVVTVWQVLQTLVARGYLETGKLSTPYSQGDRKYYCYIRELPADLILLLKKPDRTISHTFLFALYDNKTFTNKCSAALLKEGLIDKDDPRILVSKKAIASQSVDLITLAQENESLRNENAKLRAELNAETDNATDMAHTVSSMEKEIKYLEEQVLNLKRYETIVKTLQSTLAV